jgi:predicted ATPase
MTPRPRDRSEMAQLFVGRRHEFDVLTAALDAAGGGQPGVVLLVGEDGMGKTALIRRLLGDRRLAVILTASGDPRETRFGWGVIRQLTTSAGSEWARALSGMRRPRRDTHPTLVGGLMVDALARLQTMGTVGLIVEDAQWADPPSMDALAFVIRRLRREAVFAVITVRPDGVDRLGDHWRRLLSDGDATLVRLKGLEGSEVVELAVALGRRITSRAAERVLGVTGGNPRDTRALLAELSDQMLTWGADPLPSPRAVQAAVARRLTDACPDARAILDALSVVGAGLVTDVAAVAGLAEPLAGADAAVATGLAGFGGIGGGEPGLADRSFRKERPA